MSEADQFPNVETHNTTRSLPLHRIEFLCHGFIERSYVYFRLGKAATPCAAPLSVGRGADPAQYDPGPRQWQDWICTPLPAEEELSRSEIMLLVYLLNMVFMDILLIKYTNFTTFCK